MILMVLPYSEYKQSFTDENGVEILRLKYAFDIFRSSAIGFHRFNH